MSSCTRNLQLCIALPIGSLHSLRKINLCVSAPVNEKSILSSKSHLIIIIIVIDRLLCTACVLPSRYVKRTSFASSNDIASCSCISLYDVRRRHYMSGLVEYRFDLVYTCEQWYTHLIRFNREKRKTFC